ncbi:glycosyltransferase [Clostridium sp. CAG:575]|nr:glycosyltransferase [Clostridium sp. CAG:575]
MKIGVVLVTYNRLEKLKIALKSYEEQTVLPKYILVVNNNSNDGTKEYLENWAKDNSKIEKIVVNLDKNTGGSGGFYEGLKNSLELDAEWVWVADDDAYPKENAFEIGKNYIENYKNATEELSAICGEVLKSDGKAIDCSHRRRIYTTLFNRIAQPYSKVKDYEQEEFEINGFSYVGTMINKEKLLKTELTKKDYFIYYDDTEHSYRLSKLGKIICIPKMQVVHDAPHSEMSEIVKWKLYYLVRNTLDFVKSNFDEKYFKEQCFEVPFKFKVAVFLFGKDKKYGYEMINEAVKDAKAGKTGLHEVFKPGWNPTKSKN